tara:strand:+ start:183 stop:434 length:252 start_codon:yes stop_codon:yes gene_type:complete
VRVAITRVLYRLLLEEDVAVSQDVAVSHHSYRGTLIILMKDLIRLIQIFLTEDHYLLPLLEEVSLLEVSRFPSHQSRRLTTGQ